MLKPRRIDHAELTETELVTLAQSGDADAFRAIMQRGNQRLFRIARGIVRDDAEAEDVLQEAYVRAFAAIARFRGEAGIMTWLTTIVMNDARGRLRRKRPTVGLETIELGHAHNAQVIPFPNAPEASSPEADAAVSQVRKLIERAVDALPESFRMVFILRDIEGCSVEETARQLGIKPETVKTRLHRARRQLREALDAQLASTLVGAFPFLGVRCQRIVDRVLVQLAAAGLAIEREPAA